MSKDVHGTVGGRPSVYSPGRFGGGSSAESDLAFGLPTTEILKRCTFPSTIGISNTHAKKQLLSDCENQGGARGDFCRVETVEISLNSPNHSRAKRISIQEWDLRLRLDGTLMKAVRFEVKKGVWDQCQTF